jgi:hypothetical protein
MTWRSTARRAFRYDSRMLRLEHLLGWVFSVFRSREELLLENLALLQQQLAARKATSPSTEFRRPAVLGRFVTSLLRLEEIVDPCHPGDRCSLASGWVSAVLELDLACEPCGWKEANQQGSGRANLPYGRRKPKLGSTTHSRGGAQVGIRHLGTNGFSPGDACES